MSRRGQCNAARCLGLAAICFGYSVSANTVEVLDAPAPTIEEILVEAPEPRYVAPTLRDRIGRVWVPVMISGQGPFRLVLDTGATTSAIVGEVAERIQLPPGKCGAIKLQGATGLANVPCVLAEPLEVGDLLLETAKLAVVPNVFGGAEGVLGTQGLANKRIRIDFKKDSIVIENSRGKPRPEGLSIVRFEVARGRLAVVMLSIGGVRTKAIIDTGAQHTIGNNALREALLLRPREVREEQIIGVTMDVATGQSIRTPPIVIGSVVIRNLRITFGDVAIFDHWKLTKEPAMLIGMDVLGTLETLVIDYGRRELQLRAKR